MKKKYYVILLFTQTLIISSCQKNWLDARVDLTQAVPSSFKDFQALLDNTSVMNTSYPSLREMAADGKYVTESVFSGFDDNQRNAYTWSQTVTYQSTPDWNSSYERIEICNTILDGLEKNIPDNPADVQTWNYIKGQALFIRGKNFFDLAETYSPPYSPSTSVNDLGICLRLESDVNIPTVRSSVKETYERIIADLAGARDLLSAGVLPNTPLNKTRATKAAAFAMLARVYIAMGEYTKAGDNANNCLSLFNTLLDYNDYVSSTAPSPIPKVNAETIFYSQVPAFSSIGGGSGSIIDSGILAMYGLYDVRKTVLFKYNTDGTANFKGSYDGTTAPFVGLAVDEIYLIRAECYARAGNVAQALNDLDTLLKKRWKAGITYAPVVAASSDEALLKILNERKKELIRRSVRWSDLRRLNRDSRFAVTLTRTISGKTYIIEPNSYKYTFPIPDNIIKFSGVPQNSGW